MIKKLILLLLVVCGGVVSANADVELYLHNQNDNWNAYPKFDNKGQNPSNPDETVWEYVLNSSTGLPANTDFYFRLKFSDYNSDLRPYNGNDYSFKFENGQNETYKISHSDDVWGNSGAFKIAHSSIGATEYKITVYANRGNVYYLKVDIVSMPVKIGPWGYTTFSCNRALDLSTVNNAYYVASNPTESVKLVQTTGTVPAGVGLVLYGEQDAEINIPVAETASATAISGNLLVGCPNGASLTKDNTPGYGNVYVLVNTNTQAEFQNVKDWLDKNNTLTIPAGKAYLQATGSGSGAPSFSIELGDETTGIMETVRETTTNNQYYTLDGRRVAQPTKGLYIVNGKKVIIK